jgi:hypothetical protein
MLVIIQPLLFLLFIIKVFFFLARNCNLLLIFRAIERRYNNVRCSLYVNQSLADLGLPPAHVRSKNCNARISPLCCPSFPYSAIILFLKFLFNELLTEQRRLCSPVLLLSILADFARVCPESLVC